MKQTDASWKLIVKAIKKVGKEKVFKELEKEHLKLMDYQAGLYVDPKTSKLAQKLQRRILQQEITLAKIKHFDDAKEIHEQ